MEGSETLTQLPLDFSVTMMNIKIKNELNNNTNLILTQNNSQQTSSAFKVVTPRKSDGKNFFSSVKENSWKFMLWLNSYPLRLRNPTIELN